MGGSQVTPMPGKRPVATSRRVPGHPAVQGCRCRHFGHFRPVALPLCASVSFSVKWGQKSTCCGGSGHRYSVSTPTSWSRAQEPRCSPKGVQDTHFPTSQTRAWQARGPHRGPQHRVEGHG